MPRATFAALLSGLLTIGFAFPAMGADQAEPRYGLDARGAERLGDAAIGITGFEAVARVLHLGQDTWLAIGQTSDLRKQLRLVKTETGSAEVLAELGGRLDDVWRFVLAAAPFEVDGHRPIAVLVTKNYGGNCCQHHEVSLLAGLVDGTEPEEGGLPGLRKAEVAITDHEAGPNPSDRWPWAYLGADLGERGRKEEARFFFLEPSAGVPASLVVWRKTCVSRTLEATRADRHADADPCAWGFELSGEHFDRYPITAEGFGPPAQLDAELRPHPGFWKRLRGIGWGRIGVSR